MWIAVIGINHKSTDLELREKLAKACARRFDPSHSAHGLIDYVLLSTCNRTEIYFSSENLAETHSYLLAILRYEIKEEFEHCIYSYFGRDCFFHLARVTAGIDSAIIGETEIQGQVKQAYEKVLRYRTLSRPLHFLFQKSLKIGKEVRSKNIFTRGLPTLEEAILNGANSLMGDLRDKKILFVGLSEINRKVFARFRRKGLQNITFCNRSSERLKEMAVEEEIYFIAWEHIQRWVEYDLVILGTKSPYYLVRKNSQIFKSPKLIIDLSVPRNVDPSMAYVKNITLFNVDQLNALIDQKRKQKAIEVARLETEVIAKAIDRQATIFRLKEQQRLQGLLSRVS